MHHLFLFIRIAHILRAEVQRTMILGVHECELTHVIVDFDEVMMLQRFLFCIAFTTFFSSTLCVGPFVSELLEAATFFRSGLHVKLELKEILCLLHHDYKETAC